MVHTGGLVHASVMFRNFYAIIRKRCNKLGGFQNKKTPNLFTGWGRDEADWVGTKEGISGGLVVRLHRRNTEAQLEKFRQDNEEGVTFDGVHYTGYEATQRQRKFERSIRSQKRKILVDEATGDKDKLQTDQIRLQRLKQEYKRFSDGTGLRVQHERLETAGFDWKKAKAAEKAVANLQKTQYNTLQKLQYKGETTPELEANIEKSLAKIPVRHRELAESKISTFEITDSKIGSSYNPRLQKVRLSKYASTDTAIHEYAHALANAIGAYDDPAFKTIMRKGFENITLDDIVFDEDSFVEPIYRVESDKFISKYQGRLYESVGIFDGKNVSLDGMLDYFSEGYEEYIRNPENLKAHDADLFDYFEGIK